MATQLRRSLYVGLGGTGINAILHTKKMFMEAYGEIPPMIGFLGIDTDNQAFNNSIDANVNGKIEKIVLDRREQWRIQVAAPLTTYQRQKNDTLDWIPEKNVGSIRSLLNGAGQIRSNGRLGLIIDYTNIKTAIQYRINQIRAPHTNPNYGAVINATDDIHLIFSICGGTGAGIFIDIAYLIKQVAGLITGSPSVKIFGYAVLPEVFKAMYPTGPAMINVKPNAYASALDLDFLMHLDNTKKSVLFKFSGTDKYDIDDTPFSSVVMIDNKHPNRVTYTHIERLTEMLSVPLFISACEWSSKGISVFDNIEAAQVATTIKNKKSWVSYLGASEIIFKGSEIADIYSKRAVRSLIQILLANDKDPTELANAWISHVKIRETGANDLIDSICSNILKSTMEVIDPKRVEEDIQMYYNIVVLTDEGFKKKEDSIRSMIMTSLENFIQTNINEPNSPILSTLKTLEMIKEQVIIFKNEMLIETTALGKDTPITEERLSVAIKELNTFRKKWIKFDFYGKKKDELQDDVRVGVYGVAVNKIELKRRIIAVNIYDALLVQLQREIDSISEIPKVLATVDKAMETDIAILQNHIDTKNNQFDINLGGDFVISLQVDTNEIALRDFIDSLPSKNLYNINNQDTIKQQMLNYTKTLNSTLNYEQMTVDDCLKLLSSEKFEQVLREANAKAFPLTDMSTEGYPELHDSIARQFYVGVYRSGTSPVETNNVLSSSVVDSIEQVVFVPTGMKDRVVFYRLIGPTPAFAVSTFVNSCESNYRVNMNKPNQTDPHFDKNLLKRMIMEEHALLPSEEQNVAMKYWVLGFLFGFIKRIKGNYYFVNTNDIEKGDGALVSLQSKRRTEAYIKFRQQIEQLKIMFDIYLSKIILDNTVEARAKYNKAVEIDAGIIHYYNSIADCEINRNNIKTEAYKEIKELIDNEIDFVVNQLLNSIESYIN